MNKYMTIEEVAKAFDITIEHVRKILSYIPHERLRTRKGFRGLDKRRTFSESIRFKRITIEAMLKKKEKP